MFRQRTKEAYNPQSLKLHPLCNWRISDDLVVLQESQNRGKIRLQSITQATYKIILKEKMLLSEHTSDDHLHIRVSNIVHLLEGTGPRSMKVK